MTERRVALIIASYQYQDADLRRLVAPAQDAEALARVLADPAVGSFEVQTLLNESSDIVRRAIEAFFTDRKRNDLLLLYFSGHGIKDEGGQLYFVTADTQRKLLRSTAIPATLVNEVMRYSRSRRQVLLLDCCYSGAFARGMVAKADETIGTQDHVQGRGRVVLTASDAMQYAFEGDELTGEGVRSVFTHALVHGLETGEADLNGDGHISLDELYDYVYDRVVDATPQQKPEKWALGVQGEIIIARTPSRVEDLGEVLEIKPPIKGLLARVREGAADLFGRLRWGKKRVSRHTTLLVVLVLLTMLGVGTVSVLRQGPTDRSFLVKQTPQSTPSPSVVSALDGPVRVGVASFADCPQVSDALPGAIDLGSSRATYESLGEIQDRAAARTQPDLDLVMWGRCPRPDQLTMHLEILKTSGPEEVSELESVTAQTSSLDLNHASGLGRAVINYLCGDYEKAAGSLATWQQEARELSEQAELAFLRANSLLFVDRPERYEESIRAYDDVLALDYDPLLAQVRNNRGVAGVNWALQLGRSDLPYEEVLEATINDLEVAATTPDTDLAATAYVNLGAAQYWVAEDYDQSLVYCEEAIRLAPEQPLGYVCRAAARYGMLYEDYCDTPPDTTSARDDLVRAERRDSDLADIFFWRGALAELQADCSTIEEEERRHRQDAMDNYRAFSDLAGQRRVTLFIDQVMEVLLPASLSQPNIFCSFPYSSQRV